MQTTPKGLRLHIGIFGKRNVGKSSVINRLVEQSVSIVSQQAGTTTDPVEKPMELLPLGPVVFIDTAGIDDIGALGEQRIKKTEQVLQRTEVALLVIEKIQIDGFETKLINYFKDADVPLIIVFNKSDVYKPSKEKLKHLENFTKHICVISAKTAEGIDGLRKKIIEITPPAFLERPVILSDLVGAGEIAVLVVPIDKEAPKGRLILPQVQAIRDLLDGDAISIVCKERELAMVLKSLNRKPALVVTDSQAFLKVAADTPADVLMTSFSIVFARFKGDLYQLAKGAMAIEKLRDGDKILIAESCTHHPIEDDIGTVKIPRWLNQYIGGKLKIDHYRGHDFPANLSSYKLVVHCAACVANRQQMLNRIKMAGQENVPITNYGMAIAYTLGIFERALKPFGEIYQLLKQ